MKKILLTACYLLLANCILAQLNTPKNHFTKADSLRGSNNENRSWWDVLRYDITVKPDFEKKEIEGLVIVKYNSSVIVNFKGTDNDEHIKIINKTKDSTLIKVSNKKMQIDLQEPLKIDSAFIWDTSYYANSNEANHILKKAIKRTVEFRRDGETYLLDIPNYCTLHLPNGFSLYIYYHGKPREAKNAPWDGGWVWAKDKLDRPFVSVACQGLGASCWFPCKDYQGDEPDNGASLTIDVQSNLIAISNGNLKEENQKSKHLSYTTGRRVFDWSVSNPINTYCIVPYIGNYVNFTDTFQGEKGTLDLSYWVLDYNKEKAEEQFKQVKPMLKAFEYWFGAYPFYEDGYKLVEAPYLGMEHQSAIAYGNGYKNGYKGRDLSGSGWGLKWDFIIVHESGHEWFANSITTNDIADMWVHEGFTNYSEVLFTEYYYGKQAGNEYCYGLRKNIRNDEPIIGPYGVNKEGSGDMYYKAANMIHSIRNALNDDEKFRKILREMNEKFYHKTIDGKDIQQYLIEQTGLDLQKTFEQYLTTTQIPALEYYYNGKELFYRYSNCIAGFNMPITIPSTNKTIVPTTQWQHQKLRRKSKNWFTKKNIERLFLLKVEEVNKQS